MNANLPSSRAFWTPATAVGTGLNRCLWCDTYFPCLKHSRLTSAASQVWWGVQRTGTCSSGVITPVHEPHTWEHCQIGHTQKTLEHTSIHFTSVSFKIYALWWSKESAFPCDLTACMEGITLQFYILLNGPWICHSSVFSLFETSRTLAQHEGTGACVIFNEPSRTPMRRRPFHVEQQFLGRANESVPLPGSTSFCAA